MLARIESIATARDTTIASIAHAGDGDLHPLLLTPAGDDAARTRAQAAFTDIIDAALELGGTVTGEHGVGLLKMDVWPRNSSPPSSTCTVEKAIPRSAQHPQSGQGLSAPVGSIGSRREISYSNLERLLQCHLFALNSSRAGPRRRCKYSRILFMKPLWRNLRRRKRTVCRLSKAPTRIHDPAGLGAWLPEDQQTRIIANFCPGANGRSKTGTLCEDR
jgi:hypothetical protein